MRYIGRIITTGKVDDVPELIDVTNDFSLSKDAKIPTLIVGYKNAKKMFGNLKITEKRISDNIFWTFSKRERRSDYISDIDRFYSFAYGFLDRCCKYEYVDMVSANKESRHHISEIFKDLLHKKVIYQTDTMYYIYYPIEGKVYGVSKDILKFLGYSEWIISGKVDGKSVFLASEESGCTKKFMIPVLYYLKTF